MRLFNKKSIRYYKERLKELVGMKTPWHLSDEQTFLELQLGVHYIMGARVPGDIAEFGSHGRSAVQICKAMKELNSEKNIHLFDSFEGFPKASNDIDIKSPHVKGDVWPAGGSKPPVTPNQLAEMLKKHISYDQIYIYKGWFADTLKKIPGGTTFSMVHIDCDLYQSTHEVLDHLFSHGMVSNGCIIYFDDWYCNQGFPAYGEQKAWSSIVKKYNIFQSQNKWYGWAGKKLIVHDYEHI